MKFFNKLDSWLARQPAHNEEFSKPELKETDQEDDFDWEARKQELADEFEETANKDLELFLNKEKEEAESISIIEGTGSVLIVQPTSAIRIPFPATSEISFIEGESAYIGTIAKVFSKNNILKPDDYYLSKYYYTSIEEGFMECQFKKAYEGKDSVITSDGKIYKINHLRAKEVYDILLENMINDA